ncbi:MAG TPA: hypothetical protein VHY08_16115 [Bacillota bacterium]|nr:hypothetical protein [Bacillota bacterium]
MQKTRRGLIFRTIFLLTALTLFTTSIVFAETFTPLKKDALPNSKSTSIIFGRIYMTSQIGSFNKAPGKTYVFNGIRNNEQEKVSMTIGIKPLSDEWKGNTSGVWGYNTFFALRAEPGDYSFENVTYNFEDYYLNPTLHIFINSLTPPFQERQLVKAGKLVYFGVIHITFVAFEMTPFNNFNYRHNIYISNDFDNDLKKFKAAYPKTYKQFKDNIVIADFANLKRK